MTKNLPDKQGKNREKVGRGNLPKDTRWKSGQSVVYHFEWIAGGLETTPIQAGALGNAYMRP